MLFILKLRNWKGIQITKEYLSKVKILRNKTILINLGDKSRK